MPPDLTHVRAKIELVVGWYDQLRVLRQYQPLSPEMLLFSLKPRTLLRPPMLSRSSEIRRSCAYWACRSFCQFQRWLLSSNTFQPASSVQMALFALPSSKPSSGTGFAPSIRVPFFRLSAPLKTALGKRTVCLTPNRQPAVCLFLYVQLGTVNEVLVLAPPQSGTEGGFLLWSR